MTTKKQIQAAKANIKKAQKKWKEMSSHQRARAQPQGKDRAKPGTGPAAKFYRIEIRPSRQFSSFRTHDVGRKGNLERIAGHRASGSWDTQAWLVSKDIAHVTASGELVIDNETDRVALEKAVSGKIVQVKPGIFKARPVRNVPERIKPTAAMKRAQLANIKKAQLARRKPQSTKT